MLTQGQDFAPDTSELWIHSQVRRFVQERVIYRQRCVSLGDDKRYVDAIVSFLEREFAVSVAREEMTEDNFGSVRAVARFVSRKQKLVLR